MHHVDTAGRKRVLECIKVHGPMTTLDLLKTGLNARCAVGLYAEGKLEIGPAGYQLPVAPEPEFCGCGCGGFPNAKHEADLMRRYYDEWPRVARTPWIAAHEWSVHMPPVVVAVHRVTPAQLDAMTDDSGATSAPKRKPRRVARRHRRHAR